MSSWKTVMGGLGMILPAIGNIFTSLYRGDFSNINWAIDIPTILGGIGLFFAKDYNVSNAPQPLREAQPVSKRIGEF